MINILIVDDSAFMRNILTDILKTDKNIRVVGQARNGKEALEKIPALKPDLVTLDIEMPIMDGISTLEKIIEKHNIPVVMISSLTVEGANSTVKALEKGAVDFIPKPENIFSLNGKKIREEIIDKIKMASQSKVSLNYKKTYPLKSSKKDLTKAKFTKSEFEYIIAIASSTGGPRALQEVLSSIPGNINGSIVIAQHMPPKFTKSLADRLDTLTDLKVEEGKEGDILKRGYCYIAPGGFHMRVKRESNDYILKLSKEEPIKGLRPAADILMKSVAELEKLKKVGIVMTGMGSDGSQGIIQIKQSGGSTIAQDEKTSVVFGMPKIAIETNNIDKIVSLDNIAKEILNIVGV